MTETLLIILLTAAAYLLGSVSNAVWIGKTFYGTDVREHGSHNAGATNTMRILGRRAGIAVFVLDFLKGFIAVSLAALLPYAAGSPALFNMKFVLTAAVVLGHIFPLFAGFRGGKGVATRGSGTCRLPARRPAMSGHLRRRLHALPVRLLASMTAGILLPVYTVFVFGQHYLPLSCSAVRCRYSC